MSRRNKKFEKKILRCSSPKCKRLVSGKCSLMLCVECCKMICRGEII